MLPVSICLTTYNRAAVLPQTLEGILAQSFGDFELIIGDDSSSDATEQVCSDYCSRDRRIRYFRNSTNLGMPGNLNAAIARARGTYVANLHDGDIFRPDLIEKWKRGLDAVPDAPFVFNAYQTFEPDGTPRIWREPFEVQMPGEYIADHYFRTITCCVWGTVMARATAYARVAPFDATFGFISDVDMWLRLALRKPVAYVNEPLMTLTRREPSHPHAQFSWQHLFWQFGILARHLPRYRSCVAIPKPRWYSEAFRRRALYGMLSLIRHQTWGRVREGPAIWRDADDPLLRVLGQVLGRRHWAPSWYDPECWESIRYPDFSDSGADGSANSDAPRSCAAQSPSQPAT